MGRLIPAGTGMEFYRRIKIPDEVVERRPEGRPCREAPAALRMFVEYLLSIRWILDHLGAPCMRQVHQARKESTALPWHQAGCLEMREPRFTRCGVLSLPRSRVVAIALLAAGVGLTGAASAQTIVEFPLPTGGYTAPTDIAAGADGNLWFTEEFGNNIGRITPSGVITEFPIPTGNSWPLGIAAGPDGNIWFTEANVSKIGRITPAGVITEFAIPAGTYSPWRITAGADGNLWFTELGNKIGRITPGGVITEFPVPTSSSSPEGIAAGPDGHLWFAERLGNRIGRLIIPVATDFYTLTPCRVFDTRELSGPTLGAPLTCGTERSFTIVGGTCGVPASAKAISLNLTGTASTAPGNLRLFAPGAPVPLVSNLNYAAEQTRGNNAVAPLSAGGQISILCAPSGTTHVIMDLNGYFQ